MDLGNISDDQLIESLETQFSIERKASHSILLHLKEILLRQLFAKRGFPDLFWMLIRHFKQSESAAQQRLKALDLMLAVSVVEERLVSGDLSLSTVAMAQRHILREEKLTGVRISQDQKAAIVDSITGKTIAQSEVELFKRLPATASNPQDQERRVSADATRMSLTVPDDVRDMMIRLKELWAHVDPSMDHVEVMRRAFKLTLKQIDPRERKQTRGATDSDKHRGTKRTSYYGKEFDRVLWQSAGSRCQYVDEVSGLRCDCTFGLQREHVVPLALGGTNELSNMELLCRAHNELRARRAFGDRHIERYQTA